MIALFGDVRARLRRVGYACARRGCLLRDRALLLPEKRRNVGRRSSVVGRRQTADGRRQTIRALRKRLMHAQKECCNWRASIGSNFFKETSPNPTGLRTYPHPALARHLLPMGERFKIRGDEALSR
ncbi:hypothetical protein [Xanthomonas arboricola]|uniref:hypothetical protein n=1 Tax=Xanthomonas arboricola TaxID=56448 RepID=UPI0011B09C89|nr:hypothetical protein [Xanthomonas arboricola]